MVSEAGDPVTTSVQGVVPVPLLMPNDQVHVESVASQILCVLVMVHSGTAAIMETEFVLDWDGAATTAVERRPETRRAWERMMKQDYRDDLKRMKYRRAVGCMI